MLERFLDGPFQYEELSIVCLHMWERSWLDKMRTVELNHTDIGQIDKFEGEDEDVNAVQQRRLHDRSNQKHKQVSDNERRTANSSPSAPRQSIPRDKKPLSGYEDIVSSGTDPFTSWVKMNPHEVLVQHMVDIHKATADFREASERTPATSSQTNRVNKHFSTRSPVQKRLSIYNWNSGPYAKRKMPSKSRLQAGGTTVPCRRHLSMSTMTFFLVGST